MFICPECIELCYNIVRQERKRLRGSAPIWAKFPSRARSSEFLDQYVIGQEYAKKSLSVAVL